MCIRDRVWCAQSADAGDHHRKGNGAVGRPVVIVEAQGHRACLLYTSDAADERSSVDLGGRRIIKKKKNRQV